jgi:hypothetical protein
MRTTLAVLLISVLFAVTFAARSKSYASAYNYLDGPIYPEADAELSIGEIVSTWARAKDHGCYSQEKRDGPCYDSSSFVYNAWKKAAGKDIKAQNTRMYPTNALREVFTMQPGDILWRSGFTALYVGNHQTVAAENEKDGIRLRDLSYYTKYFGFTKIYRPI